MVLYRWNRCCLSPDGGSSGGGDGGAVASSASATDSGAASAAPSEPAPSGGQNSIVVSDPSNQEGLDTPIDELKAGIKAHAQKQREAAKPGAAPPATPAAPVAPQAPAFTDQHYQTGAAFGLDKAHVEAFGSPDKFAGWVRGVQQQYQQAVNQQVRAALQQFSRQQQQQRPQPQPALAAGTPPGTGGAAPNGASSTPLGAFTLDDPNEELDPRIHAHVKHQNDVIAQLQQQLGQIAPLQQQFAAFQPQLTQFQQWQAQQQERTQADNRQVFDNKLNELDPELFGDGDRTKWTPNHVNARVLLADDLYRLELAYQARGEALPPIAELAQAAYRMRHADRIEKNALAKAAKQSREVRGQATAVPNAREHRPMTSDERRHKVIAEKLKEQAREVGEPVPSFAL